MAYLPDSPAKKIPPENTQRIRIPEGNLEDEFQASGYQMTMLIENLCDEQFLTLRMYELSASYADYALFYQDQNGVWQPITDA